MEEETNKTQSGSMYHISEIEPEDTTLKWYNTKTNALFEYKGERWVPVVEKGYKGLPFSKKEIVIRSRHESYVITVILVILVLLNKDVSSISILATLSWGGYNLIKSLYVWLIKHEHVMDKSIELKKISNTLSNKGIELEEEIASLTEDMQELSSDLNSSVDI